MKGTHRLRGTPLHGQGSHDVADILMFFFVDAQRGTIFREPNSSCSPCISVLAPHVQGQKRTYSAVRKLLSKPCARKVTLGGFLFRCSILSQVSTAFLHFLPYLPHHDSPATSCICMSHTVVCYCSSSLSSAEPAFLCCFQKASQPAEFPAFPKSIFSISSMFNKFNRNL